MTREYANFHIQEFIAGGPKYVYMQCNIMHCYFRQYAMKLIDKKTGDEKYVIKLRGITLNHENAKRIQYDKFKEMVMSFGVEDQQVETEFHKIGPDQNSQVMTKYLKKKYTVVNRKGLISNNLTMYPFGFK